MKRFSLPDIPAPRYHSGIVFAVVSDLIGQHGSAREYENASERETLRVFVELLVSLLPVKVFNRHEERETFRCYLLAFPDKLSREGKRWVRNDPRHFFLPRQEINTITFKVKVVNSIGSVFFTLPPRYRAISVGRFKNREIPYLNAT